MERTELYVRVGATIGCFAGVGYGLYDIMQTFDLSLQEAISVSLRTFPNLAKSAYGLMTRDTLAGVGAGGLTGGLVALLTKELKKNITSQRKNQKRKAKLCLLKKT